MVGLESSRPYDLRHSFASLLLAEQMNTAEVARQLGHSLQTVYGTYAHVIDELVGRARVSVEAEIRTARKARKIRTVAQPMPGDEERAALSPAATKKTPPERGFCAKPTRGLEPRTPSLRVKCSTS